MRRVALYVRMSAARRLRTSDAVAFNQERCAGVAITAADRASGSNERRRGLDRLVADAKRKRFDVVVVWRFDLFARCIR
jgi:DNA invertase Pin-like site-specific DNA recombinase